MKEKILTFFYSLGIPLSALMAPGGCTGICGKCQLSCFPGVLVLVLLGFKYLFKSYLRRMNSL